MLNFYVENRTKYAENRLGKPENSTFPDTQKVDCAIAFMKKSVIINIE